MARGCNPDSGTVALVMEVSPGVTGMRVIPLSTVWQFSAPRQGHASPLSTVARLKFDRAMAQRSHSHRAIDRPLAKGWAILENPVFGTWLMRIEAGLLLTYAKVTRGGLRFWW